MANNQIALMAQAPVFDTPMESQGKALQLRSLMNQGQVQDMDMAQRRQAVEDDAGMRDVYRTTSDPVEQIQALYRINPKAAMAAEKSQLDLGKTRADMAETTAKTQEVQAKVVNYKMQQNRDMLNTINTPQDAARWVQGMFSDPDLAKVFSHGGDTAEQAIARIPQDPQKFAEWKQQSQLGAEKLVQMTTPDANARLSAQTSTANNATTNATTQRGQNMTAGTAAAGRAQSDRHFGVTSEQKDREIAAGGKPPPGYRWNGGNLEAIPGGPGDKLPESQQKQVVGVNNLSNAIAEYRTQLGGFGNASVLSPDARAAMGTKYNNMMLQAKEAYNLGVLNGPDLEILTSVITDPRSMKGIITSNKALDSQASELDRIMQKIGTVSGQARQPQNKPGATNKAPGAGIDEGSSKKGAAFEDAAKEARFQAWKAKQ